MESAPGEAQGERAPDRLQVQVGVPRRVGHVQCPGKDSLGPRDLDGRVEQREAERHEQLRHKARLRVRSRAERLESTFGPLRTLAALGHGRELEQERGAGRGQSNAERHVPLGGENAQSSAARALSSSRAKAALLPRVGAIPGEHPAGANRPR